MKTKGKVCPLASFRSDRSAYIIQTCDKECAWFNKDTQGCAILMLMKNQNKPLTPLTNEEVTTSAYPDSVQDVLNKYNYSFEVGI